MQKSLFDYGAIIFDMDGTLYYQFPLRICMAFELSFYYLLHIKHYKELLIIYSFRKMREQNRFINSNDFEETHYNLLAEKYNVSTGMIKKLVNKWINEKPLRYVCFFRDHKIIELLKKLKFQQKKIIIYSDYPVKNKIEVLGLVEIVNYSFCASDSGIKCLKPDPKGLKYIINAISKPVEDILFIGNRYSRDGLCAKNVKMDYLILDNISIFRWINFHIFCKVFK